MTAKMDPHVGAEFEAVEGACPECGTEFTALVAPGAMNVECQNCGAKFPVVLEDEE